RAPPGGCSSLIEHGRSLRRRLAEVAAFDVEVLPVMDDGMDLGWIGVDAALTIPDDGVVLPAGFPQLVTDFDVFVDKIVALVMAETAGAPEASFGTLEIGGDDVPRDAAFGQMIERRNLSGEPERMGV